MTQQTRIKHSTQIALRTVLRTVTAQPNYHTSENTSTQRSTTQPSKRQAGGRGGLIECGVQQVNDEWPIDCYMCFVLLTPASERLIGECSTARIAMPGCSRMADLNQNDQPNRIIDDKDSRQHDPSNHHTEPANQPASKTITTAYSHIWESLTRSCA